MNELSSSLASPAVFSASLTLDKTRAFGGSRCAVGGGSSCFLSETACPWASNASIVVATNVTETTPNSNGQYSVAYAPEVSGYYTLRVALRTAGGLLASYYAHGDLTSIVGADADFCPGNVNRDWAYSPATNVVGETRSGHSTALTRACNATRLYANADFAWGSASPLLSTLVTLERFSVSWVGYVVAPTSGSYTA